ncbi:MAG: hypothetical protein KatS3mg093_120 [Candidatus Parcubacteria bacterium]|nr:MAG: hypothetical protein KatS3mg093_120 [Candidatus Parcubacteria bacterium]
MTFLRIILLDDLIDFIDFWFHHFPKRIVRNFFDLLYYLDKFLGLKANLRNITKPFFRDFSVIGYAIALPFRLFRIFIGGIIYFFIAVIYLVFIIIWLLLPIFLLSYGILF